MIRVEIQRDRATGRIAGFRLEGHALFAESGKDIVCAGASAVAVGTVNAAEEVAGVRLSARMEPGLLHVDVPKDVPESKRESLQFLLEAMLVMLRTIEQSYGKHIRLHERQT
ncbi:ribosomal-processing cysteine protease Prp [Paenibacillus sp.]|uniref:ribosomal-processing cysteine protease Prp n=1 Tax=Paenibacillus sp. TaxID=58172 RepID=UPI002D54205E|nr:ribosomal-processing cysteine protease Prp [Paenibacillus sp.]HZG58037.1 ribosomal-processing cysteine protease Prp [Paenibacillus sp.]